MTNLYENQGKIRNTIIITVTAKAESLSLTIPRETCEVYNILAGDRLQVELKDHFRIKNPDKNSQ